MAHKTRKPDAPPPPRQADTPADPAAAPAVAVPAGPEAAPPAASTPIDLDAVAAALAAPFAVSEVKFKPQAVSNGRALAVPYVDARVVMDRLDDVLGVLNWQDSYEVLPDGAVVCRLRLRLGCEWITKEDVGGESEQPDEGDRRKAAFSDALKRAAVKFGIGRFLYRSKPTWCDYDPQKKQFVRLPILAGINAPRQQPPAPSVAKAAPQQSKPAAPAIVKQSAPEKADFHAGLGAYDRQLADKGLCQAGDLVKYVAAEGKTAGFASDLTAWADAAVLAARDWTKAFVRVRHQETLDELLTAAGKTAEDALKALRKPPGASLAMLSNEELWELIVRLRKRAATTPAA